MPTADSPCVATLDVPSRDPRAARGLIRLEPVRLEMLGERWEAQGPILVRREPGRFTLERLDVTGRLGTATATGRLDDGGTLDGTLRGQVPLALLTVLRREVREAAGQARPRRARRRHRSRSPTLLGRGTISERAARATRPALRDSAISKAGSRSRRRGFASRSSRPRRDGNRSAPPEKPRSMAAPSAPIRSRSPAAVSRLTPVEGLDTVWNADLTLVGRGDRGFVRGEAQLVRGAYTRDLSILPLLLNSGPRTNRSNGAADRAQIDVHAGRQPVRAVTPGPRPGRRHARAPRHRGAADDDGQRRDAGRAYHVSPEPVHSREPGVALR